MHIPAVLEHTGQLCPQGISPSLCRDTLWVALSKVKGFDIR